MNNNNNSNNNKIMIIVIKITMIIRTTMIILYHRHHHHHHHHTMFMYCLWLWAPHHATDLELLPGEEIGGIAPLQERFPGGRTHGIDVVFVMNNGTKIEKHNILKGWFTWCVYLFRLGFCFSTLEPWWFSDNSLIVLACICWKGHLLMCLRRWN